MLLHLLNQTQFRLLYNCSFYNVSDIPLERRQNVPMGIFQFSIATIEEILYVPCIISIWRQRASACYKFMLVMSLLDMVNLALLGPITGVFSMLGFVYCSSPALIFMLGVIITFVYIAETLVELSLAINRCVHFVAEQFVVKVCPDNDARAWLWMLPPLLIGVIYVLCCPTSFYSGLNNYWCWSPHGGYAVEMDHLFLENPGMYWWYVHNILIMIGLPASYVVFFLSMNKQMNVVSKKVRSQNYVSTRSIFLQVSVISLFNCLTCTMTIAFTYFNVHSKFLTALLQFTSVQAHGIPSVIYLAMNRRIRKDVKAMMFGCSFKSPSRVSVMPQSKNALQSNIAVLSHRHSNGHC